MFLPGINRMALLLAAVLVVGCEAAGPDVRMVPGAGEWIPARVLILPATAAGNAVPVARALPDGLASPTASEAAGRTTEALERALKEGATLASVSRAESFSRTPTAALAGQIGRQYLESRTVDPQLVRSLAGELDADAVLLTALLRYGPEVEGDVQQMQQSAQTKVGSSNLAISSATSRAVVYFNAHLRCALVRLSDGAVVWDAAIREHRKRSLIRETTQDVVIHDAVGKLLTAFPWRKTGGEAGAASGK